MLEMRCDSCYINATFCGEWIKCFFFNYRIIQCGSKTHTCILYSKEKRTTRQWSHTWMNTGGTKDSKPDAVTGGNVLHFPHVATVNSAGRLTYDKNGYMPSILHCWCFIVISRQAEKSPFMRTQMEDDCPDDGRWGETNRESTIL